MLKVLELRMWSASRPGVATTTCGWLDSSRAWVTMSAHNTAESAQSTSIRQKQTKFMENGNTGSCSWASSHFEQDSHL